MPAILPTVTHQPLGEPVVFAPVQAPLGSELTGTHVLLRPIDPERDAEPLFGASHLPDGDPSVWTYLFGGPYEDVDSLRQELDDWALASDRVFYTVLPLLPHPARPSGVAGYLRIDSQHGSIEIGNIMFVPGLQRTTAATEAIFLLACHAFDELGYRRLEWKCDALNAPSRRAAERFGFEFEGVFEQHMVIKARNRDTAWYAITDRRWPAVRRAFEAWLAPSNFDATGRQRQGLGELMPG
ncbi:MAG: GNAT family N-acetyltransferase [Solirubrobacteraceae bacterium]